MRFILKGLCHENFDLRFFYQPTPPGTLIYWLKPFWIYCRFVFAEKFDFEIADFVVSGVNDTAKKHLWQQLSDANFVLKNLVAEWTVSMTPLTSVEQWQWQRWSLMGIVNDTVHQYWHRRPHGYQGCCFFKGNINKTKPYIGEII
jgi:hypothetical protein